MSVDTDYMEKFWEQSSHAETHFSRFWNQMKLPAINFGNENSAEFGRIWNFAQYLTVYWATSKGQKEGICFFSCFKNEICSAEAFAGIFVLLYLAQCFPEIFILQMKSFLIFYKIVKLYLEENLSDE